MEKSRGFTLVEILLVLAIITLVAGSGFFVLSNLVATDVRDATAELIIQGMRRAQFSAAHMRNDDAWGVFVASTSATVFRGNDAGARDIAYDESFVFPDTVTVGGISHVVFGKGTGVPVATATISITFRDESRFVVVNEAGAISYEQ